MLIRCQRFPSANYYEAHRVPKICTCSAWNHFRPVRLMCLDRFISGVQLLLLDEPRNKILLDFFLGGEGEGDGDMLRFGAGSPAALKFHDDHASFICFLPRNLTCPFRWVGKCKRELLLCCTYSGMPHSDFQSVDKNLS